MSMHLDFDPHSWYMGFAIKRQRLCLNKKVWFTYDAYTENGNTYRIDRIMGSSVEDLKKQIRVYHLTKRNGYGERIARRRLEELRVELRGERLSYGELAELASLVYYIDADDVELQEAAGVEERQIAG